MKEFYETIMASYSMCPWYWTINVWVMAGVGVYLGWRLKEVIPFVKVFLRELKLKKKEDKG